MLRQPTIDRQQASYRQGVILGLTMAEALLLLVFCLMLGLGAFLKQAQVQRDHALHTIQELNERLAALKKLTGGDDKGRDLDPFIVVNPEYLTKLVELTGSSDRAALDETWRRLVRNNELVQKAAFQGLNLVEINEEQLREIQVMRSERAQPGDRKNEARANAEAYAGLRRILSDAGLPQVSDQQFAEAAIAWFRTSGHKWPPIINLSEAAGYSFAIGSAELTPDFAKKIRGPVADRLAEIAQTFDVDVIEVVGHTDEQRIAPRPSNLDQRLPDVLTGGTAIGTLRPADNAGLGLARALSVVSSLQSDTRLAKMAILPLSGAQLITVDEKLARAAQGGDASDRRRIEIRLRKSSAAMKAMQSSESKP